MQLISICNELTKRVSTSSDLSSHGSDKLTSPAPLSNRISMKFLPEVQKQGRLEHYDIQQPLWKIIQTNRYLSIYVYIYLILTSLSIYLSINLSHSNELSQVAVATMSLIRGELQISCFYFLHKFGT
jgi:hypothetical protein